ncbi:MAG: 23S rRNA (guanosine(2251)-2'-O)-methyltransferase RlmB [Woeseiaceae bacterium]
MSRSRFVTGLRAVEQLLASRSAEVSKLFAEYQTANPRVESLIAKAKELGVEIQAANRARLRQMSGESRHQGVVAEIRRSTTLDEAALRTLVEERLTEYPVPPLLLLVLDAISDPHNLGACLRVADAVGVDAVIVPRHGAAGLGPGVSKVAAGAAETVPFVPVANLRRVLSWLSDYSVRLIGTCDEAEESLFDCDFTGPVAIVMGGEHKGLRKSVAASCDAIVGLPMYGEVASLNVSVAAGVCLYEVLRQRRQK